MFLTQEKLVTRILQELSKGNIKRAHQKALDGIQKWPEDFELAMVAIQTCIEVNDYHQTVSILKSNLRKHPQRKARIIEYGLELFLNSFNPFLGSFIIEAYIRSGNIEAAQKILGTSPDSFIDDLIKRSEMKKGMQEEGRSKPPMNTRNELLLGMLYIERKEHKKATLPLGNVIESTSEQIQEAGALLLELERELPRDADVKYYLGRASVRLSHPARAEERFFQCLELSDPPLEKLLDAVDTMEEKSPNRQLLKGELLIRMGDIEEGVGRIKLHITGKNETDSSDNEQTDEISQALPEQKSKIDLVFRRLSGLPKEIFAHAEATFLYCDVAVRLEHIKKAVEALKNLYSEDADNQSRIISWLESNEIVLMTAPAQKFLTRLHLDRDDYGKAGHSARYASNIDATQLPGLIEIIEDKLNKLPDDNTELKIILTELYSLAGNGEYAEELLLSLENEKVVGVEDIYRLTSEMMKHCGLSINSVSSAVGAGLREGNITEALPLILAFYRENPDQHEKLADEIKRLTEENGDCWQLVAELTDAMTKEETLSKPFRFLHAISHLWRGEVERAVFEFDQLLIADNALAIDLLEIYERAAERYPDNTTLSLALYQLYLDEEMHVEAAHYLCKTLQNDPNQLKDVLERFDKLIEKEPDNREIWEEMLSTALAMHHLSLAKEILNRALSMLSQENAAAMNIYAAKIATADGKSQDTLRHLSLTLTSPRADLRAVEEELAAVISREPSNPVARLLLGETLMRLGKEIEGVATFRECIAISPEFKSKIKAKLENFQPTSVKPWLLSGILGEITWLDGRFEEALSHLNAAQKRPKEHLSDLSDVLSRLRETTPENKEITLLYARNLSQENRFDDGVTLLEELVEKNEEAIQPSVVILQEMLGVESDHIGANTLLARFSVRKKDFEGSLEPVLRLFSNSMIEDEQLGEIAAEFLSVHEKSSRFLIPYAHFKAQGEDYGESLKRLRQAFDLDTDRWEEIHAELDEVSWPDNLERSSRLLKIDCLIFGNENDKAFALLKDMPSGDPETSGELIERVNELIDHEQRKEFYSFGCNLLVSGNEFEKAQRLVNSGYKHLNDEAGIDLKISLGEALQRAGQEKKASGLFKEILGERDDKDDKEKILKRIEHAYDEWIEREISAGTEAVHRGYVGTDDAVRLIELALERNKAEAALAIISKTSLPDPTLSILLARVYLNLERPTTALAALGTLEHNDLINGENGAEILYLKGIASERLGEYGKATAAFSRILSSHGEYRDSRSRAELNYTKYVESQCSDTVAILEKRESI